MPYAKPDLGKPRPAAPIKPTAYPSGIVREVPGPSPTPGLPGPDDRRPPGWAAARQSARLQRMALSRGQLAAGTAALGQPAPPERVPPPTPRLAPQAATLAPAPPEPEPEAA